MKLYGYEEGRENLLTMQEISISANPEELMMISRFFLKASRRFSENSTKECHIHFKDFTSNQGLPVDIIAVKE
jgi:hypothetical protein